MKKSDEKKHVSKTKPETLNPKQMKKSDEKKHVPKTKHFNDKGEPIPVINELGVSFDM